MYVREMCSLDYILYLEQILHCISKKYMCETFFDGDDEIIFGYMR